MLADLVGQKKIRARSKWKEVYPFFSSSAAYLDVLGSPGSNPLELFWDVVDDLDQALDERVGIVEDALKRRQVSFNVDMPEQEFLKILEDTQSDDGHLEGLSNPERKECWEAVSVTCLINELVVMTHIFWISYMTRL
jgi:pre-mRNA-processing factor 40